MTLLRDSKRILYNCTIASNLYNCTIASYIYYQFLNGIAENKYLLSYFGYNILYFLSVIYKDFQDVCNLRKAKRCQSTDSNLKREVSLRNMFRIIWNGRPLTTSRSLTLQLHIHIQGFVLPRIPDFMDSRILEFIGVWAVARTQLDSIYF